MISPSTWACSGGAGSTSPTSWQSTPWVIHECAHEWVADHLDHAFYRKCCELGARLKATCSSFHVWASA